MSCVKIHARHDNFVVVGVQAAEINKQENFLFCFEAMCNMMQRDAVFFTHTVTCLFLQVKSSTMVSNYVLVYQINHE